VFYCTPEDLKTQLTNNTLIQLTNDTGEQDGIDTAVLEESLIYSSTLIDGYLRGRYTLPLNTHFPLLRIIAIDLCAYRLYSRRLVTEIPEVVLTSYKNAIKTLENLQKGVVTLESETNQQLQTGEYRSNKTFEDRVFNKRKINEY
jgi:phage gp36-like protein